jgi:hypothetical protein
MAQSKCKRPAAAGSKSSGFVGRGLARFTKPKIKDLATKPNSSKFFTYTTIRYKS